MKSINSRGKIVKNFFKNLKQKFMEMPLGVKLATLFLISVTTFLFVTITIPMIIFTAVMTTFVSLVVVMAYLLE